MTINIMGKKEKKFNMNSSLTWMLKNSCTYNLLNRSISKQQIK